ncbi:MAG: IS21 family transposase [Bacilli bacterium]|nr:IS21 family transposase [Bacilli bacterium]
MKADNIKPNFSELGRIYGKDRRTVKKMYYEVDKIKSKKEKGSVLDKHKSLIREKLLIPGSNMKAVYMYIKTNKDADIGSYSNFRKYVKKHPNELIPKKEDIHLRFETEYGKQLQFDWKGPIYLKNKCDEIFEFYIFSTTLGASRYHTFIYSKFMTLESVERCLIETFETINGVPEECLTDNMSSIINYSQHAFTKEFKAFAKDMNFNPKKCKVGSPETKGKDESCNRFMNWLYPYEHEFESEEDLINIIKKINIQINKEINQTTNMPPLSLFRIEKEYLKPLPNKQVIANYLDTMIPAKVSNGLLVYYKGCQYSVPKKYINQTVKLNEIDNKLCIYYNKELIATHSISNKKINYREEDYTEGLSSVLKYKTDNEIEMIASKNLELLNRLNK